MVSLRKDFAPDLHALLDALTAQVAAGALGTGNFRFSDSPRGRLTTSKLTLAVHIRNGIQIVSIVLAVLVTAIAAISIADLITSTVVKNGTLESWLDRNRYKNLAEIVILALTAWALIAALYLENLSRNRLGHFLVECEEQITFAAETADLGLWRWDAATDRFWSTAHCRKIFGLPDGAQCSMAAMSDAIDPDDRAGVAKRIVESLESNSPFVVEYRVRVRGGQTRWIRVRGRPELEKDGRVAHIAGSVLDVTDRKRMEEQVEQQEKSLAHLSRVSVIGELSGALAHELKQPLTAILSNAQAAQRLLDKQPVDIAELRNAVADIIHDDARAGDVIRHLRALLKNDDAGADLLDFNSIIVNALGLTRSDLTARGIALITRLDTRELPVRGNAVQLQQLLLNLIVNAADAMSADRSQHGALMIFSDAGAGDVLHASVADSGPGIKLEDMDKLFDPFFTTKNYGLGLGLSISQAIVLRHGGAIWAENNTARGATFHISLPLARRSMS